jgi:phosphotransferase system HPr-like phosphotransfer protein
VLLLAASCGTRLLIRTSGVDEDLAISALVELVEQGLGEDTDGLV